MKYIWMLLVSYLSGCLGFTIAWKLDDKINSIVPWKIPLSAIVKDSFSWISYLIAVFTKPNFSDIKPEALTALAFAIVSMILYLYILSKKQNSKNLQNNNDNKQKENP